MPKFILNGLCSARALVLLGLIVQGCPVEAASSLEFDKTFNDIGAPPHVHFQASYAASGAVHSLEVWRSNNLRLKRRTDDAVETYLSRRSADPEWSMSVLDLRRKIRTDVDRTNLYRIGHFADWFGLAHSLVRPVGPYTLTRSAAPDIPPRPLSACRWYALVRSGVESRICWSASLRLPMLIASKEGVVQWRIGMVDTKQMPTGTFDISDAGYVRNDANSDIRGD